MPAVIGVSALFLEEENTLPGAGRRASVAFVIIASTFALRVGGTELRPSSAGIRLKDMQ